MSDTPPRKLAVILHADVVGSTALVQLNEILAHERIRDTFRRFSETISKYGGVAHEIRGDALVAEFSRASDAVSAALAFQAENLEQNARLEDEIRPAIRVGVSLGEVVVADGTVTGIGVVLAQRLEQLAKPNGVVVQSAVSETVPTRLPFEFESLGEQALKGFEQPVRVFNAVLRTGAELPLPDRMVADRAEVHPTAPKQCGHTEVSDKPSIGVLPFVNATSDLEQQFFVEGIADGVVTELSKHRSLKVKSLIWATTPDEDRGAIGKEYEVRYLLGGRVQKGKDRPSLPT